MFSFAPIPGLSSGGGSLPPLDLGGGPSQSGDQELGGFQFGEFLVGDGNSSGRSDASSAALWIALAGLGLVLLVLLVGRR